MHTMTRTGESSAPSARLLLAFELSQRVWKLGFTLGVGQRPYVRQIPAGAVDVLATEIAPAKTRFGLSAEGRGLVSCYEAGRDGFWLPRYLVAHGVANQIVDSSSIEVNRRPRRTKTDQLGLGGLLRLPTRDLGVSERRACRVIGHARSTHRHPVVVPVLDGVDLAGRHRSARPRRFALLNGRPRSR